MESAFQGELIDPDDGSAWEDPEFLSRQLVTYIGNKRSLGRPLGAAIARVRDRLGGRRIVAADLFAGSGFVSRLLKQHADALHVNDLEPYAAVLGECFLANRNAVDLAYVAQVVDELNNRAHRGEFVSGFVQELYAPADDTDVQAGERAFYTTDNARRIDLFAQALGEVPTRARPLLLGPLLSSASVRANTSGVFKGFYKDRDSGLGKYGATAGDALTRILAPIKLEVPLLSRFEAEVTTYTQDANVLVRGLPEVDLAYVDPPYNQHPYGSNYFMLNLIADYRRPGSISEVSGIPVDWTRSGYNVKRTASNLLEDLIQNTPARFMLISFNDEGYVTPVEIKSILQREGNVEEFVTSYNAFRGSRNLRNRSIHVNEHLFLLERT